MQSFLISHLATVCMATITVFNKENSQTVKFTMVLMNIIKIKFVSIVACFCWLKFQSPTSCFSFF